MDLHTLTRSLHSKNDSKIVMLVADGLGGLPNVPGGGSELETANTPHLDALAARGVQGASIPVAPGISPGSGPGHLGLFGYDPLKYVIGRGALEATGIGFELQPGDVAIRCNFCTLDDTGCITDRRAGRIPTEQSVPLVHRLRDITIPNLEIYVEPVKEHRFVVVLRGTGMGGDVRDTDPQATGVPPLEPVGADEPSQKTAGICKEFLEQARGLLADESPANLLTMRGIAMLPEIPRFQEVYGLNPGAIAVYPMYRGLARLVQMDVLDAGTTLESQMDRLEATWNDYDFFFIHFKYTDSTGEDGDFDGKVARIEQLDAAVPRITALNPDV
ncbi:MAG: phosphoglycerate mutase, partial [Planctomycetaceae bacterium]|nr:phosphoglycerate mutase [Planctomycetaceae bacterium]